MWPRASDSRPTTPSTPVEHTHRSRSAPLRSKHPSARPRPRPAQDSIAEHRPDDSLPPAALHQLYHDPPPSLPLLSSLSPIHTPPPTPSLSPVSPSLFLPSPASNRLSPQPASVSEPQTRKRHSPARYPPQPLARTSPHPTTSWHSSMFHSSESPPALHHSPIPSDRSRFPSRDSTPATPVGFGVPLEKRSSKDRESALPWFKKPIDVGRTTTSLCLDTTPLEPDFDDHSFPLFGGSPPDRSMAGAAPIDISMRQVSTSPRGQQPSNLTSALQKTNSGEQRMAGPPDTSGMQSTERLHVPPPSESNTRMENGARPITSNAFSNDRYRRESFAQSMGGGMSWGGLSVGSWIRDDIMTGTSPFAFHQSPSYHSQSYLPKLEANFMKDFACCGLTLPTLHDLLQHYEEAHAQKSADGSNLNGPSQPPVPDSRAAISTNTAAAIQRQAQQQQMQQQNNAGLIAPSQTMQQHPNQQFQRPSQFTNTLQAIPDMDTVEDMEMDDVGDANDTTPPPNIYAPQQSQSSPQTSFNSPLQPQIPQLNTGMMQGHQAYRNSTPTTPIAPGRGGLPFQNPAVSSINTPTLMGNPMQQQFQDLHNQNQYRTTPDSSNPGTPGEIDEALLDGLDDMSMQNNPLFMSNQNGFSGMGLGMSNDMVDLCIDEPAKRLFSPTGGFGNQSQQFAQLRLGSGQYGANSDIAKRIREQQMLAGLPDTTTGMLPHEEPKPFRCPVIGCEKAYKNQNGLKYHKSHGHNNQRLHDNADGTFSIVNPETSAPYPGTQGMEKEKPYKCDVCQKRYKNLNGLKYHKTHSPPCNPDLQLHQRAGSAGMSNLMHSQNMSNLGAGLSADTNML